MRRFPHLALVAIFYAVPQARADDWPVPRGPSSEPRPYQYDAKLLKEVPREFLEDAPACILFTRTTYLLEADGTVVSTTHEITRFNGRKGIEKLGEYRSISFNPRFEKVTLNEARVHKADGGLVQVEPRHVQLRDVATDYQVYDEDKQVVISWPNLQVGDAYEVKWTTRSKNPEFAGEFFTRYNFGDDEYPVVRDELYVRVPAGKPFKYAAINGRVELTRTEGRGQTNYHWQVVNKSPLPRDDDRPSREELRLQIACSTFASWDAVAKWKQKVRSECWECTDAIKQVVAKVAAPQPTSLAKARALTYWVRQNIRYLSRGPEGMGYTPHPPAQVLGNRFGDCKDQAQLLAVMLREIGLPVWLVTLGTLDDGQVVAEVPSPWGTHAIVMVELDGREHWIDTTVSQAGWDFLPKSDCNRLAYLTKGGAIQLTRTPEFTYEHYRIEQTTRVTIAPDGTSRSRRQVAYHGTAAWSKREAWTDAPPGERRRLVTAELQDANSRSRLMALKVDEATLREYDGPVRAEVDFEIPEHFAGEPHEGVLNDSAIWNRLLAYNVDVGREIAFELSTPFESIHRFIVALPPALRCSVPPEDRKIESPWGFFALTVDAGTKDPHQVEIRMHTRLEKTRVERGQFVTFQRFRDDVNKAYRAWLTLGPTHDLADAAALEALLAKAPNGEAYSAKVLARLYVNHNKSADARRVLAAAVKHHPDDKALWELRLQAAADLKDKETLYRAMIQQFPTEGQYVAALGASLVQRGEYAEAREVLEPLAEHENASVRGAAHFQLARVAFEQGKFKDALKHLDFTNDPDVQTAVFKGRVHEKLGEIDNAIATYRLGLVTDDQAHDLLYPLVRLEWAQRLKSDALDHLRKYTVAIGNDPTELVKAAELHLLLGRTDDAMELVGRVPKGDLSPVGHRILGLGHLVRDEHRQAIAELKRADGCPDTSDGLINAHLALGELDDAIRSVKVAPMIPNHEPNAHQQLWLHLLALTQRRDKLLDRIAPDKQQHAAAARSVGQFVCAEYGLRKGWPRERIEKLLKASLTEMELAPALALRGWLALEKGQLTRGLADAEKAIALKPADARAFMVRGRVRLERGDGASALADLEEAAKLSQRHDAIVLHWLAAAQAHAGHVALALETQRRAVELRPNDAELVEQLRQLEKQGNKSSE
jgi:tetratricopeptide (TPR) repeat protein/transglutaminase-like putative cysteine protease